ncbi:DUF4330 family protein [Haloarcula marina]|uniref:DUF4330 family protein n=1 Tax=Haloarcula marina TaxID=2961574 RepID=UPI0020B81C18|nr:DUF4330 family protein [Halomicroarcula marina]
MTDTDGPGRVIDGEGRLFGVINVVDALVVAVLLSAVLAGAGLVLGGPDNSSPDEPTRYATFAYAVPLPSDATGLETGDTLDAAPAGDPMDVVAVTRSVTPDGEAYLVARVAYTGDLSGEWVWGDGLLRDQQRPLYGGDETEVMTHGHRTRADILAIDQTDTALPTTRVGVTIAVNESVADSVAPGTDVRVSGDHVATIERIADEPTDDGTREISLELTAWNRSGTPWFGGRALRVDNRIAVVTDDAVLAGRLQRVGTANTSQG